jgi:hypothetical protein
VYVTEGINPDGVGDSYAPPDGVEALATALGVSVLLPAQYEPTQVRLGLLSTHERSSGPLVGNLGGGAATGGLAQWAVPAGSDGHFVVFDVDAARLEASTFLRSFVDAPPGSLGP